VKEQLRLVSKLQEVDRLLNRLSAAMKDLRDDGLSDDDIHCITKELELIAESKGETKKQIRRDLLTHYERFYKRHNDNALAKMVNGVCQACFVAVPSSKRMRVRQAKQIEYCENCGAILVFEETEEDRERQEELKKNK